MAHAKHYDTLDHRGVGIEDTEEAANMIMPASGSGGVEVLDVKVNNSGDIS